MRGKSEKKEERKQKGKKNEEKCNIAKQLQTFIIYLYEIGKARYEVWKLIKDTRNARGWINLIVPLFTKDSII